MTHLRQLVIDLEGVRPHRFVARLDMRRQGEGDRRGLLAVIAAAFERKANRVGMGHITLQGLDDGGIELARPIALQQLDEAGGGAAQVSTALGGTNEQGPAGRRGLRQAIGRPMAARLTFPRDQRLDMRRVLDLLTFVETARMAGNDCLAVDDTQPIRIGQHGQGPPDVRVGHGVIVQVEPDIRCLAGLDRYLLDDGIGIVRQRQQSRSFLGEDLGDAAGVVFGAAAVCAQAAAPGVGLGVEIVDIL